MKKLITVLALTLVLLLPVSALAAPEETGLIVRARAALLMDADSGRILFEADADKPVPIASVTKVMTLNLIFDALENGTLTLEETVRVSAEASGMGGSQVYLDAGSDYPVSDLIKSIIMASANDACVAMAERLAGSEDAFVVKMNQKAQKLHMTNTTFKNCTGLPCAGHVSTARDVALMSRELLTHDLYFRWSTLWTDAITHPKDGRQTGLVNTNKLIRSLAGCDGLKTGSTNEARFCVTTTAKRGEMRLISVILGGDTSAGRFADAAKLINYGFAHYGRFTAVTEGETLGTVNLAGGKEKTVTLLAGKTAAVCVKNDESEKVETVTEIPENVQAPVKKGQVIGSVTVKRNGVIVETVPLTADRDYPASGFFDRFKDILSFWK